MHSDHITDVRLASHTAACNISKAGWWLVINDMGMHMLKRDHTNLHYQTIGIKCLGFHAIEWPADPQAKIQETV